MEVNDFNDPDASKLTVEDKKRIKTIVRKLIQLRPLIRMPVDPKIYPLLEVMIDMLETQIELEMHFTYDDDIIEDSDISDEDIEQAVKEVREERAKDKEEKSKPKPKTKPKTKNTPSDIPNTEDLKEWFDLE